MAKKTLTIKEIKPLYDWVRIFDLNGKAVLITKEEDADEDRIIIKYNAMDFHKEKCPLGVIEMTKNYDKGRLHPTLRDLDVTIFRRLISEMLKEIGNIYPLKPEFELLMKKEA